MKVYRPRHLHLTLALFLAGAFAGWLWGCSRAAPPPTAAPVEPETGARAGTPASPPQPTQEEQEAARRLQLLQQKRRAEAARLLAEGRELYLRAEYEKALEVLSQARFLDPKNEKVVELLNRVAAALDQRLAAIQDQTRREALRRQVALEQARIRAQSLIQQGDQALGRGDYAAAVQHYEDALTILRHGPYGVDLGMDQQAVANRLKTARERLKAQEREKARAAAEELLLRKAREEAREAARREERVRRLLRDANRNFQLARFDEAEKYLRWALKEAEPGSRYAVEAERLLGIVKDSRHERAAKEIRARLSEEWKRVFADLKLSTLIPKQEIEFPENWAETVGRRQPASIAREQQVETEEDRIVKGRLERIMVTLAFEDNTPFRSILDFFHKLSGINFILTKGVHEKLQEAGTLPAINARLPLKNALELVLDMAGGFKYKIQDGLVKIMLPEEARAETYLDFYNVKDLVNPIKDFPGIEINLTPSGAQTEAALEGGEQTNQNFEPDRLVDLIKGNIAKETWEADPAAYSARIQNGILIVKHTREVHRQIRNLLEGLRRSAAIMVALEARFLLVEDNFLEDIGVDFRGLGDNSQGIGLPGRGSNVPMDDFGAPGSPGGVGTPENPAGPGTSTRSGVFYNDGGDGDIRARTENLFDTLLGNPQVLTSSGGLSLQFTYLDDTEVELILRAVRKSERISMVTAPRITVYNTERANVTVLNQVSYIRDFDAEIAQAAAIVEPVVDVIQDGVVLDVRPIVSADRRYITMDLRPTVAVLTRPIPTFTASVATGTPVTLELPRLEVQRVRTTVTIPDNATVLLGGLKFSEERDVQAGIPFLNKIPIVSLLASRKGKYVNRRNLLILLKAKIIIPGEVAPRPVPVAR